VQCIEKVSIMTNANFHIFGMGLGSDQLQFIGWTQRALSDVGNIIADLTEHGSGELAQSVARGAGPIELFEIESAASQHDAEETVQYWCLFYRMLGARVVTATA
jgi:hypothetical protein